MFVPFSPPPGINSDDTAFAAAGQWADGDNWRFEGGSPRPVGNIAGAGTVGSTFSGVTVVDIFSFERSGTATIAYGVSSAATKSLYVGSGLAAPSNRTPAAQPTVGDAGWSFAAWGNTLLGCIRGGTLWEQSGSGAATEVTNAPNRIDAGILITPERQVLAFSCNEEGSGTHNPLCIRGCDLEDYTDWTTSASNNAFEHIIDGVGTIICPKQVGPFVAVLTTGALYQGQFIGDPSQTYRFDKVAEGCGPISKRAAAEMGGVLYWMGQDYQLRAWTPGSPINVIPCPIWNEFVANAGGVTTSFLLSHSHRQEIWFFFVDGRDSGSPSHPTRYIAYSISESAKAQRPVWFRGQRAFTSIHDSEIVRAVSGGSRTGLIAAEDDGSVYLFDIPGAGLTSGYIQSADFYLDNSKRRMMIQSIRPDIEDLQSSGAPSLSVSLFMRDHAQGSATTKGPYTVTSATTKKDVRASGKIAAVKIAHGTNEMCRLGKCLFDVTPMGDR